MKYNKELLQRKDSKHTTAYGHVIRERKFYTKTADNQLDLIVMNTEVSWLSLPIYTYTTGGVA